MSDIVNAFKQTKGYKKRKDLLSGTQEVKQTNTYQEQETPNTALEASQNDNIAYNTSGTKDSDRLAQLQQLAAAETAQNEANRQAAAAIDEAKKQEQEAQKQAQMSRSDKAKISYNDLYKDEGEGWYNNQFWKNYQTAAQKAKDSGYKDVFGSSAFDNSISSLSRALQTVKKKDNNAIGDADKFISAYNQLSSDDKWDVYQNIQEAKNKIVQAYTKADNENNKDLKDAYGTAYRYISLYDDLIGDIERGDKSFGKSLGDWLSSGGFVGEMAQPITNALGDITGNSETSKRIEKDIATKKEGGSGVLQAVDVIGSLVGNTALALETGGISGLVTSGANLAHEGISALNDQDREYYVDDNGNVQRQNRTTEQKISSVGGAMFNLALSAAGMKGVGPNIKFSGGQSIQSLAANKNYGEIAKGLLKYAGKELPWAAATTAGEIGIQSIGNGADAWKNYGENLINNIIGDVSMDAAGAIREGQTGNRDLFRINQETGRIELDGETKAKLSDEDNAKIQKNLDDFQEGVKQAVDNEGKVDNEVGKTDQEIGKQDLSKLNQDAAKVSQETNTRITAEEMARNADNSRRVNQNNETLRDVLNSAQKQVYNKQVEAIRADLEQNKITYDQYLTRVEQIQETFLQQAQSVQAQQVEESPTGQKVNPEDVTNVVENAEGTQASEVTTKQTTPEETFSEARNEVTTKQSEMGEGMARTEGEDPIERGFKSAEEKYRAALESGDQEAIRQAKERYDLLFAIRANEDVTGLDYKNGVILNEMLGQEMFRSGYDGAGRLADQMFNVTEGNRPLAFDYGTGEPLYMYDDIVAAIKKYGGKDALGNQFKTADTIRAEADNARNQAFRQAIDESISGEPKNLDQFKDQEYKMDNTPETRNDTDMLNDLLAEAAAADRGFVREEAPARVEEVRTENQEPEFQNIYREQDMARRQELLSRYNELGMTPELQEKIQAANIAANGGKADLSALTPEEMNIYRQTLEFNPAVKDVEGSIERAYLPQQYTMDTEGYSNRSLNELLDTGTNDKYYEKSRTGAVAESGNIDYSNNPLVDWHMRAENSDLQIKAAALDQMNALRPEASQEQKVAAADKTAEAVNELNHKVDDAVDNGISDKDFKQMKPVDKLAEAGDALGVEKTNIDTAPKGMSDYEKLRSIGQWDDGARFQDMQNINAIARNSAEEVDNMISGYKNLTDQQKQDVLRRRAELTRRYAETTGSNEMATYLANRSMIKDAWMQNMLNYATTVNFTNLKTKNLMNEYASRFMMKDRYTQSVAQKVGSAIQRVMNSSFRGARVQTTLNEIPEIVTSMADYGMVRTASIKPSEAQAIKAKYGMSNGGSYDQFLNTLPKAQRAEIQSRLENATTAKEQVSIMKEAAQKVGKVLDGADTATQWNGFVQDWKDATFLQNAERYYTSPKFAEQNGGKVLQGAELTNRVLSDFYQRMLPMDRVFKYIKSDSAVMKPMLMYFDSSARLTAKAIRGAIGSNDVGVNANKSRGQRIARNAAFDLAPRALSAMAMGVPLASVVGMFNIGGQDYSGIDDEDKTVLDEAVNFFGQISPILSLASYAYNQQRQDEIAEAKGQDTTNLKGDAGKRALDNVLKTFTPLGNRLDQDYGIFGNINSTKDVLERGAAINKQGRVQYLSPDNPIDMINALISGVNRTSEAREYNKNPDLLSAIINQARGKDYNGDGNNDGGFNDFIRYNQALNEFPLDFGLKDENDYNRPLNQYENSDYSGKVKEALESGDRQLAQEWYEKGRAYNALLDNLRTSNPDAADVYYASMGNNLVSPEKWKTVLYGQNPNGEPDLTVWNLMKDMALKRGEDFGTPVDPAYTQLDDEQTRRYLQYKSTATGEDTALKKIMTQDPFWKEFFNAQKEYYASLPESEYDDSGKTQRVQEWNDWNDKYSDYMSFISGNIDGMNDQQLGLSLSLQFPLMSEYQSLKTALEAKYGDEYKSSQEYKNFWSQNYDAYQAESDAFNEQMLYIINQMRRIEGYDDMTLDEMEAINNIGKESKSSSYKKSSGSSSGGGYSYAPIFENTFQASPVYASVPNPTKMHYNPAGRANFYNVPMSGTMGGQPYAAV